MIDLDLNNQTHGSSYYRLLHCLQRVVRAYNLENTKAPHHCPFGNGIPVTVGLPSQKAINAETVSMRVSSCDTENISILFVQSPCHYIRNGLILIHRRIFTQRVVLDINVRLAYVAMCYGDKHGLKVTNNDDSVGTAAFVSFVYGSDSDM